MLDSLESQDLLQTSISLTHHLQLNTINLYWGTVCGLCWWCHLLTASMWNTLTYRIHLNDKPNERVGFRSGKEFGAHKGNVVVIIREIYCLKGSGSAWEFALRQLMRYLGLTPYRANGEACMRMAVDNSYLGSKTNDGLPSGERYYEYILIRVDNIMVDIRQEYQVIQATICI